jgi:hypothetical protein
VPGVPDESEPQAPAPGDTEAPATQDTPPQPSPQQKKGVLNFLGIY